MNDSGTVLKQGAAKNEKVAGFFVTLCSWQETLLVKDPKLVACLFILSSHAIIIQHVA